VKDEEADGERALRRGARHPADYVNGTGASSQTLWSYMQFHLRQYSDVSKHHTGILLR
jgi:hypothetical protein